MAEIVHADRSRQLIERPRRRIWMTIGTKPLPFRRPLERESNQLLLAQGRRRQLGQFGKLCHKFDSIILRNN